MSDISALRRYKLLLALALLSCICLSANSMNGSDDDDDGEEEMDRILTNNNVYTHTPQNRTRCDLL